MYVLFVHTIKFGHTYVYHGYYQSFNNISNLAIQVFIVGIMLA